MTSLRATFEHLRPSSNPLRNNRKVVNRVNVLCWPGNVTSQRNQPDRKDLSQNILTITELNGLWHRTDETNRSQEPDLVVQVEQTPQSCCWHTC